MAKKKTNEEASDIVVASEKDLDRVMKELDAMNKDASMLSESPLSEVSDWISTDCYALNAMISGSCFKGIPSGRIGVIYGPPATGKTMIVNKIIANAQKKGFTRTIYFDTENALDGLMASNLGCDLSLIKHAPVETVEECKIQVINMLNKLIEIGAKNKVCIVIDSLGNLSSEKEFKDTEEKDVKADMGLKAKALSSMMRMITYRAARINAPVLCTNHIYQNPDPNAENSMIKKQSGGMKHLYISSWMLQLNVNVTTKKEEDAMDAEMSQLSARSGVKLDMTTTKNRFVPPMLKLEQLMLNFKTGLSKYGGLFDLAQKYAIIERNGTSYKMVGGANIGFRKDIEDSAEFWENGPLQALDAKIQKDLTFSNVKYAGLAEELEKQEMAEEHDSKD